MGCAGSQPTPTAAHTTSNTNQEVHAAKADEAYPDGRLAPLLPQILNFLDALFVEVPSAVEHDRGRHNKERPFCSGYASCPHR